MSRTTRRETWPADQQLTNTVPQAFRIIPDAVQTCVIVTSKPYLMSPRNGLDGCGENISIPHHGQDPKLSDSQRVAIPTDQSASPTPATEIGHIANT